MKTKSFAGMFESPVQEESESFSGKTSKQVTRKIETGSKRYPGKSETVNAFQSKMPPPFPETEKKEATVEERIEGEYIKNLQQQVYFLELETAYLREQAEKASAADAYLRRALDIEQKYINDTKCMRIEIEELMRKLKQKEFSISNLESDKKVVEKKLEQTEKSNSSGKRNFTEENVSLKKKLGDLEEDLRYLNEQFKKAKESEKKTIVSLASCNQEKELMRNESEKLKKENRRLSHEMEDLNGEIKKLKNVNLNSAHEFQEEISKKSSAKTKERDSEIFDLKLKLRQAEMNLEQAKVLQHKMKKDCGNLLDANSLLTQEVAEVNRDLAMAKNETSRFKRLNDDLREQVSSRPDNYFDRKQFELVKGDLEAEVERVKELSEQLIGKENELSSLKLEKRESDEQVGRLSEKLKSQEGEFIALKRDKLLLVDHVAELQEKLKKADDELKVLRTVTREMKDAFSDLTSKIEMESNMHKDTLKEYKSIMSRNNKMLNSIKSTVYDLGVKFPSDESRLMPARENNPKSELVSEEITRNGTASASQSQFAAWDFETLSNSRSKQNRGDQKNSKYNGRYKVEQYASASPKSSRSSSRKTPREKYIKRSPVEDLEREEIFNFSSAASAQKTPSFEYIDHSGLRSRKSIETKTEHFYNPEETLSSALPQRASSQYSSQTNKVVSDAYKSLRPSSSHDELHAFQETRF